jgi:Tol biopolymer transport system component
VVVVLWLLALTSGPAQALAPGLRLLDVKRITWGFDSDRVINPCFTPDGRMIVFNGRRAQTPDGEGGDAHDALYIINRDGTELMRLRSGDIPILNPVCSPDSFRICFSTGSLVYEYSISTDWTTRLLTDALPDQASATYSPDGRNLLYCSTQGLKQAPLDELRTSEPPGSLPASRQDSTLLLPSASPCDREPVYSPDGESIACVWSDAGGNSGLVLMPSDGSGREPLVQGKVELSRPRWSPDGRFLVYEGTASGIQGTFVFDMSTRAVTSLASEGLGPVLSVSFAPDGQSVVFVMRNDSGQDLYTATVSDERGAMSDEFSVQHSALSTSISSLPFSKGDSLAPVAESLDTSIDRSAYRIVVFAGDSDEGRTFMERLKRAGYDNADNYVTSNPTGTSGIKHDIATPSPLAPLPLEEGKGARVLAEIVALARQYLELDLTPVGEPRLPPTSIYISLP